MNLTRRQSTSVHTMKPGYQKWSRDSRRSSSATPRYRKMIESIVELRPTGEHHILYIMSLFHLSMLTK